MVVVEGYFNSRCPWLVVRQARLVDPVITTTRIFSVWLTSSNCQRWLASASKFSGGHFLSGSDYRKVRNAPLLIGLGATSDPATTPGAMHAMWLATCARVHPFLCYLS